MVQLGTTTRRTVRRLTVSAVGLLVTATGTATAHGTGGYGSGGMIGGGWGLFGGSMGVWGLLWAGLLIVVPVYLLYAFVSRGRDGRADRPRSTLRERYARGELSDEEFDRRRERLDRTD